MPIRWRSFFSSGALLALGFACTKTPTQPPLDSTGTNAPPQGGGGGGGDGGATGDGGTCAPDLGSFAVNVHPTQLHSAGACTAAQLVNYYDDCLSSTSSNATCASSWTSVTQNGPCNTCLLGNSDPSLSTWGPLLQFAVGLQLNVGGCVALTESEEAGDCNNASQALTECMHAACDTACVASSADYASCQVTAQQSTNDCQTYYASYQTACAGAQASSCFSTDAQTAFEAVGAAFCE